VVVFSGPAQVVSSGDVTTFFGLPLLVTVSLEEGPFVLEWRFAEGDEPEVVGEPIAGGHRFVCRGLDPTPGKGTAEPVVVADLGADVLLVHFRSTRWGASEDRTVHWTVFRVNKEHLDDGSSHG